MNVQIGVGDSGVLPADGSIVTALYRWLAKDPELRGAVELSVTSDSAQLGDMGAALDVVNVVLSNSIALAGLLVAVASWRTSRASAPTVYITRNDIRVKIDSASPEVLRRLALLLAGESPDHEEMASTDDGTCVARSAERP